MNPCRLRFNVGSAFALELRTSIRLDGPVTKDRSMWNDWAGINFSLRGARLPWYLVILLFSQKGHLKKGAADGRGGIPSTTFCVLSSVEGETWPYRWCQSSKFLRALDRPEDQLRVCGLVCAAIWWTHASAWVLGVWLRKRVSSCPSVHVPFHSVAVICCWYTIRHCHSCLFA